MSEGTYPARLRTEDGIADVIRDIELGEWRDTFKGSEKLTPALLVSKAKEVADWRIEELIEEHGSLTTALHADLRLQEQLTVFENGRLFIASVFAG